VSSPKTIDEIQREITRLRLEAETRYANLLVKLTADMRSAVANAEADLLAQIEALNRSPDAVN